LVSNTAYSITEANQLSKAAVQKMLENGSAMTCPTCQVIIMRQKTELTKEFDYKYSFLKLKAVIEKISGCDGIQCTMCKTHLCWATRGLRWGKEGRGDMTGGCGCNVNGKKCHDECKNCH
jgi:RanBP-type and C3HC4-type zinc finger-containing protein 1